MEKKKKKRKKRKKTKEEDKGYSTVAFYSIGH
jgi:hypothetical protein